jgi:hypothetical protein
MMEAVSHDSGSDQMQQATDSVIDPPPARRNRRIDKGLLVVSMAIAVGLVLIARGLIVGVTGDEQSRLPALIEAVNPVPEAVQALSQTQVFADLADSQTGVFVIDGIEIATIDIDDESLQRVDVEPGQQVDIPPVTIYEAGNSTLTFTPGDGAPIETFESGDHTVQLIYWRVDEGRQRARTFTWTFHVV